MCLPPCSSMFLHVCLMEKAYQSPPWFFPLLLNPITYIHPLLSLIVCSSFSSSSLPFSLFFLTCSSSALKEEKLEDQEKRHVCQSVPPSLPKKQGAASLL